MTIGGHEPCHRYTVEITSISNGLTKIFNYVYYKIEIPRPPFNFLYHYKTQTLYWSVDSPICQPRIFYVYFI